MLEVGFTEKFRRTNLSLSYKFYFQRPPATTCLPGRRRAGPDWISTLTHSGRAVYVTEHSDCGHQRPIAAPGAISRVILLEEA